MIGSPFLASMAFGDNISVVVDDNEIPLSAAVSDGVLDGQTYRYDISSEEYVKTEPGGSLEPWEGYFIRANRDCTLKLKK